MAKLKKAYRTQYRHTLTPLALGHKTLSMVKRYAHLSEAHTAGVVARMNQAIFG